MANRYWVGGSGTWDATTTTNWSASSGGAGGASAPTSADDVFFNSSSGAAPTVTIGTNAACGAVTITAPTSGTLTFAFGTTGVISYNGNWSNPATLFATTGGGPSTGAIVYVGSGSSTLTTNGYSFPTGFAVNTSAGTLTLAGAFSNFSTSGFIVTQGTFSTSASNYSMSTSTLSSSGTNTRTINLNGSTITLSAQNCVNFATSTNLTLNAGSSTINCSLSTITFNGGGLTFNNVNFTSTSSSVDTAINGANTFANLSQTAPTSLGVRTITLAASQTVTGTFTANGTTYTQRVFVRSSTLGTIQTITAATVSTSYADYRDITGAGAGTWSGTSLGNCGGNTGITFSSPKTVYWNLAGTQNWSATGWAPGSGGTPAVNNFPLAQDTAVFDNAGSAGTITINSGWSIGTFDASLRTSAMTFSTGSSTATVYGDWKFGTGVTSSSTTLIVFAKNGTQTITSNNVQFSFPITINNPNVIFQLADNLSLSSTATVNLTSGTLSLQSFKLSTGLFNSSNSNTRTIAFGTGSIDCTGTGTVWTTSTSTGMTTTGNQVVNVTSTGSTAITVTNGSLSEANAISFNFTGGTYPLGFFSFGTVKSVNFTGYSGTLGAPSQVTIYGNLTLSTGMTLSASNNAMTFGATSGTQTITSNNKTMDFPVAVSGGGIVSCADALTLGSTRALTFSLGTLKLKSGATNTVGSFVTSGTTLKYLQSTTAGVQATLSDASGTNTATYLSIQDSAATGGAIFDATSGTNVNAGNNSGWIFGAAPTNFGNFFMLF
jgi:hypothetical protein